MDYRAFLGRKEPVVLPYFGGSRVDAADRRLHLHVEKDAAIEPGWWRFVIDGRRAIPQERAEAVDLGALPAMRGHWVSGYVVASGRELGRIALPPEEEPAELARVMARRWYSGELLLESVDFEDDAELEARRALEDRRALGDVKGVVPSLRAAFAYALGTAVARELRVPVTLRELAPRLVAIADGGADAVRARLDELVAERRAALAAVEARRREAEAAARERARLAELGRRQQELRSVATQARERVRHGTPCQRAEAALDDARARMRACRRVGGNLDVTFDIDDVRIIATVDGTTLQVYDAGICLAGSDRELTLDSLPSVVREAIEDGTLNITRHQ